MSKDTEDTHTEEVPDVQLGLSNKAFMALTSLLFERGQDGAFASHSNGLKSRKLSWQDCGTQEMGLILSGTIELQRATAKALVEFSKGE